MYGVSQRTLRRVKIVSTLLNLLPLFLLGAISAALQATAPLPSNNPAYFGTNKTIHIDSQLGYATTGGGGEFAGTVEGYSTAFWCVDDQLYFNFGATQSADIIHLSDVNAHPGEVRYSGAQWTNTTAANGSFLPTDAAARYAMAAWLVSQYPGFDGTIDGTQAAKADAIQQAIWALTNNNSGYQQNAGFQTISPDNGVMSNGYWVNQALAHYSDVNPAHWAVVSWGAAPDGTLFTGPYNGASPAMQTFLVEAAPEPAFYGVLTVGLGGLILCRLRRQRHESVG